MRSSIFHRPMPVLFLVLCIVLIGLLLQGCTLLSKFDSDVTSQTAQPYLKAGALAAVATAEAKGVSAAQITSIAQQALAATSSTTATLATVAAAANEQIAKLGLPAADIQAAQIVEASLEIAISAQIGDNATLAQTQVAVAAMLNAIIAAANPAGIPTSSAEPQTLVPVAAADIPQQNTHFVLAAVESPAAVGAAASLVLVASLKAFWHVDSSAPVAAALTVLFTVGSAALSNLIN